VTLAEALDNAAKDLVAHNIDNARLEAEIILSYLLGIERVGLYINSKQDLLPAQTLAFSDLIQRRISHEPTAYITGHKEFFGIDFKVSVDTLIPRPDTEALVEKAIELANAAFPQSCQIADVGTGCGAIAIALALHLPRAKIYAIDISAAALEVAESNCRKHRVIHRVRLLQGDLLEPLPEPIQLVVANLPYISELEMSKLPPEISMFEPRLALAGGTDGLVHIERLLFQASSKLSSGGAMLLEVGYDQGPAVKALAKNCFPTAKISVAIDLSGIDRVVTILT
jgi:release factor glutamine methyltransferase